MDTWPRPRTARTSSGGGSDTSGAGRSRSDSAPRVSNQAMRAELPGATFGGGLSVSATSRAATSLLQAERMLAGIRSELLHPDDRLERLPELACREGVAQHVVTERVADGGHDDPLVERQIGVRHGPRVDVDRVAEPPLVVDREVVLEVREVREHVPGRPAKRKERGVRGH